jgi:hypothetical protein
VGPLGRICQPQILSSHEENVRPEEVLGQFGDFSGHWTPEQLAIIHKRGLKE